MRTITIKELNKLLIENYDSKDQFIYQFAGHYITQCGNIIYCDFNPKIFLISEFTIRKLGTYSYKLINKPTDQEFRIFLRSINPLMNLVINYTYER